MAKQQFKLKRKNTPNDTPGTFRELKLVVRGIPAKCSLLQPQVKGAQNAALVDHCYDFLNSHLTAGREAYVGITEDTELVDDAEIFDNAEFIFCDNCGQWQPKQFLVTNGNRCKVCESTQMVVDTLNKSDNSVLRRVLQDLDAEKLSVIRNHS